MRYNWPSIHTLNPRAGYFQFLDLHPQSFGSARVVPKMCDPMEKRQLERKLNTNSEYQKVVPVIMNLATASLVVPVVFIKDFMGAPDHKFFMHVLKPLAFWGWGLLAGSLFFGCLFHAASAKLVKALYGGYDNRQTWMKWAYEKLGLGLGDAKNCHEHFWETLRDVSVGGLVVFFFSGLGYMARFLVLYFRTLPT